MAVVETLKNLFAKRVIEENTDITISGYINRAPYEATHTLKKWLEIEEDGGGEEPELDTALLCLADVQFIAFACGVWVKITTTAIYDNDIQWDKKIYEECSRE